MKKKTNSKSLGFLKILTKKYCSSFMQNTESRVINDHKYINTKYRYDTI